MYLYNNSEYEHESYIAALAAAAADNEFEHESVAAAADHELVAVAASDNEFEHDSVAASDNEFEHDSESNHESNLETDNDFKLFVKSLDKIFDCPICLEIFDLKSNNLITTCCNHTYCKTCYTKITNCSLCNTKIIKIQQPNQNLQHLLNVVNLLNDLPDFRLNFNHPVSEMHFPNLIVDYVYLDTNERRIFNNGQI